MAYLACVILGIIGYIVAHFLLKPILALRTTREAIAKALALYGNVDAVCAPGDARIPKARGKYHELASTLIAHASAIPHYAVWSSLNIIPPFEDIEEARVNLMGLSDAVGVEGQREDNRNRQEHIETALRLKT